MSRNTRLAIVLSAIWLLGVIALLCAEYLNILPGQCVFAGDNHSPLISVDGIFLSCNMFSDIPTSWWGTAQLRFGQQILELDVFRLVFTVILPIAAIWLFTVASPTIWNWIAKGQCPSLLTFRSWGTLRRQAGFAPLSLYLRAPYETITVATFA